MVAKYANRGLIATTHAEATPPLDELRVYCNWPVLLNANVRELHQELALHCPACVLFWLENGHGLAKTARLIAWLRERGPRPYRIAVAHQLTDDAEATLREAGVHSVLPIMESVAASIGTALQPLMTATTSTAAEATVSKVAKPARRRRRETARAERSQVRPP